MKPTRESLIIGGNLRTLRTSRHLSADKLGELVGLSADAIRKYERGERELSVVDMMRIADALHTSDQNFVRGIRDGTQGTAEIESLTPYESGVMRFLATGFSGNKHSTIVALDVFTRMRPERRREVIMALCLQKDEAVKAGELDLDGIEEYVEYLHACLGFMY